ncbi:hypothetical protein [Streptomyces sp. VRA16 Mangrove soil]|uniref:hypothetical protein n=1 Tax=Streptomyces sp. VRA16 Mangrove soil TaxID=2817434 RepID=UPI001A9DD616|nr:hypothetical protein [Streptomyces sp. VRA16 Mangrove soil]MBO1337951.1 hypothetical protein [Streptomyces sp. VRA16 Mangrove soil]
MTARPRILANRTALGVLGVCLLGAGLWLVSFDRRWATHLPSGRHLPASDAVLLDRAGLSDVRTQSWWTPAVVAVGVIAAVVLILCLVSQMVVRRPARLALAATGSHLNGAALEEAIRQRTQEVGGVARCRVRTTLRRRHLHVVQMVWLEPGVAPAGVLGALNAVAQEARFAVEPRIVSVHVRLRGTRHRTPRVR